MRYILIILLFIAASCRNTRSVTKGTISHNENKSIDSTVTRRTDSIEVKTDTSKYETEYVVDFKPDTGVVYVTAGDFYTTKPVTRIVIKTTGKIGIKDSVVVSRSDSATTSIKKSDITTTTHYDKKTKRVAPFWYFALLIPIGILIFIIYKKLKKYYETI